MPDVFTQTTSTSWFGRMKNAFVGVLIGLLLVPGSMVLLFWNESRAINETHRLNTGEANVNKDVSIDTVAPEMEGKLVHVAGMVETQSRVGDPVFGLEREALRLKRYVEMYQWDEDVETETEKSVGGTKKTKKTYTYSKGWHHERIASENFENSEGHLNPSLPYADEADVAEKATLGAFEFPPRLIDSVNNWQGISLTSEWLEQLPEEIQEHALIQDNQLYFNKEGIPEPDAPQVGDVRIAFEQVPDSEVTLISEQHGNSFREFSTDYGGLELMQLGILSADEVFQRAHNANSMFTWGLRALGFVLMAVGFSMIMKPLSTFASVLPILENIAGFGIAIVSFLLAASLSSVTIAVAWIAVRPILGISLLAVAGLLVGAIFYFRSQKPAEPDHGVELL